VLEQTRLADALIMAAAVADFRPRTISDQKIKKSDDVAGLTIELDRNPDILLQVKAQRAQTGFPKVTVGFAAESEDLIEHAQEKLQRKGLDMLVANDITAQDAGFEVDTNRVIILSADGQQEAFDLASKARVGELIVERVVGLL
jgi:phosphopantothenoylcysteine decarboxylase / phosphopantothenate---cysteine ligase